MASTVKPSPRIRRWTRLEYDRLIDLGVFQPGERLELLDGLLVLREPRGSRHAGTIRRVVAALRRAFGDAWQVDSQLPIALDPDSEPEPDVAVVPQDPGAYLDAHPSRPVLIVEVAESSYRVDREHKASLYAPPPPAPPGPPPPPPRPRPRGPSSRRTQAAMGPPP